MPIGALSILAIMLVAITKVTVHLTGAEFQKDENKFEEIWSNGKVTHVIGKNILHQREGLGVRDLPHAHCHHRIIVGGLGGHPVQAGEGVLVQAGKVDRGAIAHCETLRALLLVLDGELRYSGNRTGVIVHPQGLDIFGGARSREVDWSGVSVPSLRGVGGGGLAPGCPVERYVEEIGRAHV